MFIRKKKETTNSMDMNEIPQQSHSNKEENKSEGYVNIVKVFI